MFAARLLGAFSYRMPPADRLPKRKGVASSPREHMVLVGTYQEDSIVHAVEAGMARSAGRGMGGWMRRLSARG